MDEETVVMPFTPEIVETNDDNFLSSPLTPHIVESKDGNLTSSAGKTSTPSSRGKVIPHYLRASTGSCHDICKYGGHHAFEVKEKHPILKGRKSTMKEDQSPIESVSLKTRKKMSMVKVTSCDLGIQTCDIPEVKKGTKFVEQNIVSPTKNIKDGVKSSVAFKPKPVTKKLSPRSAPPSDRSVRRDTDVKTGKKADSPKIAQKKYLISNIDTEISSASPLKPPRDRSGRRDTDAKTGKENDSSKTSQKKDQVSKRVTEKSPSSPFSSPKDQVSKRITEKSPSSPFNSPKDQVSKRVTEKSPSSPFNSPKEQHLRRDSNVKTGKTSQIVQKKEQMPLKATLSPKPSFSRATSLKSRKYLVVKGVSPPKKQSKVKKDERDPSDEYVSEKILYVIEPKPENRNTELNLTGNGSLVNTFSSSTSSSSPPSLTVHEDENRSSEYGETETDSEYYETESDTEYDENEHHESSKEKYSRRPRRTPMVTEDNDPGHKLKFRRGRVVDLESENNEPRRLKFRKGRGLGDKQSGKGEVRRKSFKRREHSDGATPGKPEPGTVVLRHQDGNEKKDAQGLFNNVIEETASKLAETRKSKVKALVGAFETVISLQEKRPSTTSSG